MAVVAEVIYRLVEFVQMTIRIRDGVDSFKIYHATTELGPYAEFLEVPNIESGRRFKGRVEFHFNPSDLSWDNNEINYIKIAPVIGGVSQAQEGPVNVYPLHYDQGQVGANHSALFVQDKDTNRWIPADTSMNAFS